MVIALTDANAQEGVQKNVHIAKNNILKAFAANEKFAGEVGTDIIANILLEVLYAFKVGKDCHTISFLVSKVTPMLEAEVAWVKMLNLIAPTDQKRFVNFVNKLNKTQAKNIKHMSANAKFNVIKLLQRLDYKTLQHDNPFRSLLAEKRWNIFADTVARDVKAIRPLIYNTFVNFADAHPDYTTHKDGHKVDHITKINGLKSEVANYMFKTPRTIEDIKAPHFNFYNSIHLQSINVALESEYTFNADYNNAIQAVIESGNHKAYFSAENAEALAAKIEAVETDVENGLKFWDEVGNGGVYFNYVIDFRGRISQLGGLSSVGHKVGKAMLRAGVAKKLGPNGMKHLHIGLGSAMGHDKLTFADRAAWGAENEAAHVKIGKMIIDNPVGAFELLHDLGADDIFDAAAISLELYYIAQFDGDVEDYKSNLFLGLDATSSGLQIVSLLWGNKSLAENTNVAQFEDTEDKIYDIYRTLYEAMDEVAVDFEATTKACPDGEILMACWDNLDAKTKREIAKKLLMPRIYGSTFRTWGKNTRKVAGKKGLFMDINEVEKFETEKEYLARVDSLQFQFGTMIANIFKTTFDKEEGFQSFRDFDYVVSQVATAYNSTNSNITWSIHEPSTFQTQIIDAKYVKNAGVRYYVYSKGQKISATSYHTSLFSTETEKVAKRNAVVRNKAKAKNAISPNFIHSLDAVLLHTVNNAMATTLRLTHDCFACTPGEVDHMLATINNAYIGLFGGENNIIKKLAEETEADTKVAIDIPKTLNTAGISAEFISKGAYKFS